MSAQDLLKKLYKGEEISSNRVITGISFVSRCDSDCDCDCDCNCGCGGGGNCDP
jgi:hypothetical protein